MTTARIEDLGSFGDLSVRHLGFARAGDVMRGHAHNCDHVTLLSHGQVRVRFVDPQPTADKTPQDRTYSAPAFIHVPALIHHEFIALEDDTQAWCIFAGPGH